MSESSKMKFGITDEIWHEAAIGQDTIELIEKIPLFAKFRALSMRRIILTFKSNFGPQNKDLNLKTLLQQVDISKLLLNPICLVV